jgi:hypothetical protein
MLIVRGSCLPHRSGKGDASGIEVLSDFCPLGSKIKSSLDRGASEVTGVGAGACYGSSGVTGVGQNEGEGMANSLVGFRL